jgi:threonine/homoserine/homoserine lactone efflux protein
MLIWIGCYTIVFGCFVLFSLLTTGQPEWLISAGVLAAVAVARWWMSLFAPGLEERLSRKYGEKGARLARRLRRSTDTDIAR